jgi:hypothetical protein
MKLIGYHKKRKNPPDCSLIDEVIAVDYFSELTGDFCVDLNNGTLIKDIRQFITDDKNIIGYYGDYIDSNGFYCLNTQFPSMRSVYPGIILSCQFLKNWDGKDLNEAMNGKIVRYLPFAFYQATK